MSWMGTAAKSVGMNLGMSAGAFGFMGYMSYDETLHDPLNQTLKSGAGFAADQVQDLGIYAAGYGMKAMGSGAIGTGLGNRGTANFAKAGMNASLAAKKGKFLSAGASLFGRGSMGAIQKGLGFVLRHPVGVGLGTVAALSIFAEDLGMAAMDFYEQSEADYKRKKQNPHFHMTQSSSRFIQDQLMSMKGAGHEAEIMHN